ncbi:hypothetical protein [Singulisphaera sp. PoT]|uniref:hypothetical protein n=1 Tax=Singulisphaera sp. PoT TaxID=3411797 RepID=UPI003BF56000
MLKATSAFGCKGWSTTKAFDSPEKAAAKKARTIAKKDREGYVEKTRGVVNRSEGAHAQI